MAAKLSKYLYWSALGLLAYMPFHIFLGQWLSTYSGGLDYWKIGKDLFLVLAALAAVILLWWQRQFKDKLFWVFTGGSLAYFAIHLLVWAANSGIDGPATALGTAYNCRLLAYAVLGWAVAILLGNKLSMKAVFKIIIITSSVVALLGVLQYFLPKDLLTHFGYSLGRGVKPAFFIDDKFDLPRVMSTLRDPNSLGAYLILPITLLWGAWLRRPKIRILLTGLLLLHGLALFLTFGRAAWVGVVLAVGSYSLWTYKTQTLKFAKKYWLPLFIGLCLLLGAAFFLRDQYIVQNYIFHSDENTTAKQDSNQKHLVYAKQGVKGIAEQPLGHGPGTAGIVSIQTDKPVIPENYFIQIGYEIGVLGLVLLLALMGFIVKILLKRNDFYSKVLLASFIGITFCNFLLHTWTNEAVAAQWWLLAGLALNNLRPAGKKSAKSA